MPGSELRTEDVDWRITSFEGSRREQMRRWAQLPLENILRAVEEMQGISQQLAAAAPGTNREARPTIEGGEPPVAYGKNNAPLEIVLKGCTPEPLMSYLKALGVLRLVSQDTQYGDPGARGFWRDGEFVLHSRLNLEGLQEFFIHKYQPSPIVVPWSGKDFFNVKRNTNVAKLASTPTGSQIIEAILCCHAERLAAYREVINTAFSTLAALDIERKGQMEKTHVKAAYIAYLRSHAPEKLIPWLDAATVLDADRSTFSALLGSGGGSDGNTHFSDNFMQNLWDALPDFAEQRVATKHRGGTQHSEDPVWRSQGWLSGALLGTPAGSLVDERTSSLFDAGAVGGPNATQGMERKAAANPWNFILALEGSICFAGALAKRNLVSAKSVSSFPFQVRLSALDDGRTSNKETAGREIWLPLWEAPAKFKEIEHLLAQGRIELNGKTAAHGVDAARAVASLGTDQGIFAFHRYAIVKGRVGGENYNTAASLGRIDVKAREYVDLLNGLDEWLSAFRRACGFGRKEEAPARLAGALRRIDKAIFNYCRSGGHVRFQEILIALGRAERELMRDGRWGRENRVRPLHGLSVQWIEAARDAGPEFELALSLACIRSRGDVGPLRANLEPVGAKDGKTTTWADEDRAVIWNQADLSSNLTAVLARRMQDAKRHNAPHLPLWSSCPATLGAIAAFIAEETDDERLEDLLWGLSLVDTANKSSPAPASGNLYDALPLTRLYALLKPLFLHAPVVWRAGHWRYARGDEKGIVVRPEPRILSLLRSGRVDEAVGLAAQRLRASGLQPIVTGGDGIWSESQGRRLAAALLIPIHSYSLDQLLSLVVRRNSSAIQLQGEVA